MRQAGPLDDGNSRQQLFKDRPHRAGTEQQRLVTATQMQDTVGEDMAALEIACELHFVDGNEGGAGLARHGLDGTDRIARIGRRNLLFAGDQRNILHSDLLDDTRIDLARQQPQRQADHAVAMRHHALDSVMGFAGIGRSEHRGYAASAQDHWLRGLSHRSMHGRETTVLRSASSPGKRRRDDDHM